MELVKISSNPNITWDISSNPNITWDIVMNNPDKKWSWGEFSANPNVLLSKTDICNIIRRHRAANHLETGQYDPKHSIRKRRLLYEYTTMVE